MSKVNQAGDCLTIVLNRQPDTSDIDYSSLADVLRQASLPQIHGVRFYGRTQGGQKAEWQAIHRLSETEPSTQQKGKSSMSSISLKKNTDPLPQKVFGKFRIFQETVAAIALVGILGLLLVNTLAGQKTQAIT